MSEGDSRPKKLRNDPAAREDLLGRLDRYFDVTLALAPVKRRYLRENWLDALIVVLPFLRVLRLARILQAARTLPAAFRLLVFGGRGSQGTLQLLRRRRIGQLAIISAMVILI